MAAPIERFRSGSLLVVGVIETSQLRVPGSEEAVVTEFSLIIA